MGEKDKERQEILAPAGSDDHFKTPHVHANDLQLSLPFQTVISHDNNMSKMPFSSIPTINSKVSCALVPSVA